MKNPRAFLDDLETTERTFVHMECDVLRAAIREARAQTLEWAARAYAKESDVGLYLRELASSVRSLTSGTGGFE